MGRMNEFYLTVKGELEVLNNREVSDEEVYARMSQITGHFSKLLLERTSIENDVERYKSMYNLIDTHPTKEQFDI
jgi:hypothetical protein